MKDLSPEYSDAIAITGLAGRFPGAASVADFWDAVLEGRDLIKPHCRDDLADNFTDAQRSSDAYVACLLYTSPSPRDKRQSRMPSSA